MRAERDYGGQQRRQPAAAAGQHDEQRGEHEQRDQHQELRLFQRRDERREQVREAGIDIRRDAFELIERFFADQLGIGADAGEEQLRIVERKAGLVEDTAALRVVRFFIMVVVFAFGMVVIVVILALAEVHRAVGGKQLLHFIGKRAVLQAVVARVIAPPRGQLGRVEHQRLIAEQRGQNHRRQRHALAQRLHALVANAARQQADHQRDADDCGEDEIHRRAQHIQHQADDERAVMLALFAQALLHQQETGGSARGADRRADHRLVQQRANRRDENRCGEEAAALLRAQADHRGASAAEEDGHRQPVPGHARRDAVKQRQQLGEQRVHLKHPPVGRAICAGENRPCVVVFDANQPAVGNQFKDDGDRRANQRGQNHRGKQPGLSIGRIHFVHEKILLVFFYRERGCI